MFNFFYSFHNKPLGYGIFSRKVEDGTPSPPESEPRITENGDVRDTEDGNLRITQ